MTNAPLKLAREIMEYVDSLSATTPVESVKYRPLVRRATPVLAQAYISLHAKLERYEKALEFYESTKHIEMMIEMMKDKGKRARAALEGKDDDY